MEEKIKNAFAIAGVILTLVMCVWVLNWLDNSEKEKAYAEGRTELCYTSTGDRYYK